MLGTAKPSLTLAILAYNEEQNVGCAIREAIDFLSKTLDAWEIIVVDDGSTDDTAAIANAAAAKEPRIRVVSHGRNRGMGAGIASAIRTATKDHFVFNAADGQIAMAEIGKLLPLLDRADVVLSTYENGRETVARAALSRAFRVYLRLVAGVRFALVALGLERGLRAATTGIRCGPRRAGASKVVRPRKIAAVAAEAARFGVARRLGK